MSNTLITMPLAVIKKAELYAAEVYGHQFKRVEKSEFGWHLERDAHEKHNPAWLVNRCRRCGQPIYIRRVDAETYDVLNVAATKGCLS